MADDKKYVAGASHWSLTSAGVFRGSSAVQATLFFLDWWPPGGPPPGGHPVARPPVEPPEAHSAGRQAPQLKMEPVAPNDFRGVFRGSSAVACRQN